MIQFVSGNIAEAAAKFLVLDVVEVAQSKIGKSIEFPGTSQTNKLISRWPDAKVRFQRYLRTDSLKGGEMWVDDAIGNSPKVILIATHRSANQPSMPSLRMALKRLSRWADRFQIDSIAILRSVNDANLSADNLVKQVYYEQLSDSRCEFVVYDNENSPVDDAAKVGAGCVSSGGQSSGQSVPLAANRLMAIGKLSEHRRLRRSWECASGSPGTVKSRT